jgi:hypothetical protein
VEAPGGVRLESTQRDGQAVGALASEASATTSRAGVAARERFEGEHPLVSWSPGRDGKTQVAGYAPSECRLKPWPLKALSGAWRARFTGRRNTGFEIGGTYADALHAVALEGLTPIAAYARSGGSTTSALVGATIRPLREAARAAGWSILLTTHFSGADEAGSSDGASPLNSVFGRPKRYRERGYRR